MTKTAMNLKPLTAEQASNPFIALFHARMTGKSWDEAKANAAAAGVNLVDMNPAGGSLEMSNTEAQAQQYLAGGAPTSTNDPAELLRGSNELLEEARKSVINAHRVANRKSKRTALGGCWDRTYWELEEALYLIDGLRDLQNQMLHLLRK